MKPCRHQHDKFCDDCDLPYILFEELNCFIENGAEDEPYSKHHDTMHKKASAEFMERVKGLRDHTNFYIAHQVCATHEDQTLKDGECQQSIVKVCKNILARHSVYLLFKKNGVYTTKFYNDIGDDKEEDGFAVLSSFIDTCAGIFRHY